MYKITDTLLNDKPLIYPRPYRYYGMVMLETPEKSPFYSTGLNFSCTRCSACCRYESGFVFLSGQDVSLLMAELNMESNDFIKTYCRWIPSANRTYQLSLKEKANYDCIFWKAEAGPSGEGGCVVYKARPLQCRAFPFWSSVIGSKISWEAAARDCPGIGRGILHSRDSIEKWLALRQKEPIMSRGES